MARRPRIEAATGFYHVVNRSVRKHPLFTQPGDYRAFINILAEGVVRFEAPLVAYCVLNNHWHLLFGPLGKMGLSKVMHWVSATHATRWHVAHQSTGLGPVYQGRFRSTPLHDIASLVPMSRYVERNAKSAGLVDRAEDWPWCSLAQRRAGSNDVPLMPAAFLTTVTWLEYVNATLTEREKAREQARLAARRGLLERPVPKTPESVEKGPGPIRGKAVETGPGPVVGGGHAIGNPVRRSARRDRLRRRDR